MKRKETIKYVGDQIELETFKINDYLGKISLSQQEQIDEILLNHVSVPGLINTALLPAEGDELSMKKMNSENSTSSPKSSKEATGEKTGVDLLGAVENLKG